MKLTKKDILQMHELLIKETGGSKGIKDINLLDSAIHTPFQTFDGRDLYESAQSKAASLCYGLINNHAFIDGNKRIGVLAMLVYLEIEGITINVTDEEVVGLGLGIASGILKQDSIVEWILKHTSKR